jgi:DNA polymerase V
MYCNVIHHIEYTIPVRGLEYLDGSGNMTVVDEDDDTIEVAGVVTYALNDMRTCEFDDLVI